MDQDSATPPPDRSGSPSAAGHDRESASPVGDTFEEGQTDVGPHPSLINLETWESSDLATSAGTEDIPEDTRSDDSATDE